MDNGPIYAFVAFIALFFGAIFGGLINSDIQTTKQVQTCVQAGKVWDGEHDSCK